MRTASLSPTTVGFFIREARLKRHLTQQALGLRIQKSRYWVLRTELGQRVVSTEDLQLCAVGLGLAAHKLLPPVPPTQKGGTHVFRPRV